MEDKKIYSILEALLFVSEKSLNINKIFEVFGEDLDKKKIRSVLKQLIKDYNENPGGLCISQIAAGYQMTTLPELAPWLRSLYKSERIERLSSPAMETLAIVAYKQPITRAEIEYIRGVNAEGVLSTLLEKNLIRVGGRKETIGRPIIYNTTRLFLEYFGLSSLKDLPELEEVEGKEQLTSKELKKVNRSEK